LKRIIAGDSPLGSNSPLFYSIIITLLISVTAKKTQITQLQEILLYGFTMEQGASTESPTPTRGQLILLSGFLTTAIVGFCCILYVVDRGSQV
jgi:FtsH-binding integral membrane protein